MWLINQFRRIKQMPNCKQKHATTPTPSKIDKLLSHTYAFFVRQKRIRRHFWVPHTIQTQRPEIIKAPQKRHDSFKILHTRDAIPAI